MTANNIPANVKKNIFSENIYPDWEIDEKFFIDIAKKILKFYLNQPEVTKNCCLNGFDFDTVSFDFLYCDSVKTHEINREYRNKDYPADINTFDKIEQQALEMADYFSLGLMKEFLQMFC